MENFVNMNNIQEEIKNEFYIPEYKGMQLKSLYPTQEEIKKVQEENPDCIVTGGYGCYHLYIK